METIRSQVLYPAELRAHAGSVTFAKPFGNSFAMSSLSGGGGLTGSPIHTRGRKAGNMGRTKNKLEGARHVNESS
jgi:hypothetical protein